MRFYLGTGKYTPTAAVGGDMGWTPPFIRQWESICINWNRFVHTNNSRLNKRIFTWAHSKASYVCKNYMFLVKSHFVDLQLEQYCDITMKTHKDLFIKDVTDKMLNRFKHEWKVISTNSQVYVVQVIIN